MTTETIPQTEIEVYKKQLEGAEKYSTTLDVKDDNSYQEALIEGKRIKEQLELITARKEQITKPLNEAIKSTRALFAPLEAIAEGAVKIIKMKMITFTNEQERKRLEKEAKIDAKVEAGKISEGVASAKKFMLQPEKTVVTEAGSATTKKVKKYYVVDKALIPLQFMEADMIKIKASFRAGTPVSGVEERLENELAFGN